MKLKFILSIVIAFVANLAIAQSKTENIKVYGNCGMCKTRIEKAAKEGGATKATWNEESKMLQFTYASSKTSSAKIQQAVAGVGHDTQDFTAEDGVYEKLHECCKYDRKNASQTVADCCKDGKCKKEGSEGKCKDCTAEKCEKEGCCKKGDGAQAMNCKNSQDGCCKKDAQGKMVCSKSNESCCKS
jgi:hypothetical protein